MSALVDVFQYINPASVIIVFIYGALLGSFLNVVIYRLPLERSIVFPGSACGTCGSPLSWWENIPIFSYFLLRGRCHTCGSTFSFRYAFIEALSGAAAVLLLYLNGGVSYVFFFQYVFFCLLLVTFFTDFDNWIILDSISLGGCFLGIIASAFVVRGDLNFLGVGLYPQQLQPLFDNTPVLMNIYSSMLGAAMGWGFFTFVKVVGSWMLGQDALGCGDIKLAAMIGAFLGWYASVFAFFLSFVIGALIMLPLTLTGKSTRDPIPLGTFMAVAAFLMMSFGEPISTWLVNWPQLLGLG